MSNHKSIIKAAALVAFISLSFAGYAQKTAAQNLDELIKTENAFSNLSAATNMKKAFLANLDSTGLVFNGDTPINGLKLYTKQKENNEILLTWYPAIAAVASSGDFGFTSGPFRFKVHHSDTASVDGYYFTVWKRDANGVFKLALDGGVSHAAKFKPEPKLESSADLKVTTYPPNKSGIDFKTTATAFEQAASVDAPKAYAAYMADKAYMIRNSVLPGYAKTADMTLLASEQAKSYHFTEGGSYLSKNKDMAYTYGHVEVEKANDTKKAAGFYMRIWQFDGKEWKIIADELCY